MAYAGGIMSERHLAIGRLAKRAGVNIETIRYYERVDLMRPPPRTAGGYRIYGEDDVTRLRFIRRARELGFTLDEVRALLRLAEDREHSCAEARELASTQLSDVQAKLADLARMERVLAEMIARCADGRLPECPILEALSA
jgi:MerR family mercuric resistance operon transcriptional regulator